MFLQCTFEMLIRTLTYILDIKLHIRCHCFHDHFMPAEAYTHSTLAGDICHEQPPVIYNHLLGKRGPVIKFRFLDIALLLHSNLFYLTFILPRTALGAGLDSH